MTTPTVPTHPEGGAATPVHAVTGPSIGGAAIPVYVVSDGRPTLGQPPRRVKVITDADLTINGGNYWIEGRPAAMPVTNVTSGGDEGNVAMPVYVVSGSLSGGGGGGGPVVLPQVASATLLLDLRASQLALSEGDPVSTWADASGNGRNFTQSGTARPTYRAGGGVPYAETVAANSQWMLGQNWSAFNFDGSDQWAAFIVSAFNPNTSPPIRDPMLTKLGNDGCEDPGCTGWFVGNQDVILYSDTSNYIIQTFFCQQVVATSVRTMEVKSKSEAHVYLDGVLADSGLRVFGTGVSSYATTEPLRLGIEGDLGSCDNFSSSNWNAVLLYRINDYATWDATDRIAIVNWLKGQIPTTLTYVKGEVGNVSASEVVATFNRAVFASNFSTGVTIKVAGFTKNILSASQPTPSTLKYTIDYSVVNGEGVTWDYNSAVGNIVDVDANALPDIPNVPVANNVP